MYKEGHFTAAGSKQDKKKCNIKHVLTYGAELDFINADDRATAYPLLSIVDAEGDPPCGLCSRRVDSEVVHGETRQLTSDFKHVELSANEDEKNRMT